MLPMATDEPKPRAERKEQEMRVWKVLLLACLIVSAGTWSATAAQSPQVPLAGKMIPQFVQPLPLLSVAGGPP